MTHLCSGCGVCCRLFLINLSKKEFESGKYQTMYQENGLFLLSQNPDGNCIYLINGKCSIHPTRPQVCRHFFCTSKARKFAGMVKIIKDSKLD